jgi:hypothetical protein
MSSVDDRAPQRMKPIYYQILLLDLIGTPPKDIAAATGYSTANIYLIQHSPIYQQELRAMRTQQQHHWMQMALDKLYSQALPAIEFQINLMNNREASLYLRQRAAADLLDRIPDTSKSLRQFIEKQQPQLTDEQVQEMLEGIDQDPIARHVVIDLEKSHHEQRQQLQQLLSDNPRAEGDHHAQDASQQ